MKTRLKGTAITSTKYNAEIQPEIRSIQDSLITEPVHSSTKYF
jgi:hypothetical protein